MNDDEPSEYFGHSSVPQWLESNRDDILRALVFSMVLATLYACLRGGTESRCPLREQMGRLENRVVLLERLLLHMQGRY